MIADQIKNIDGWRSKTPEQILASLQTQAEVSDSTDYTYGALALKLTPDFAIMMRQTIIELLNSPQVPREVKAPLDFAHARLENQGLNLSLDYVQQACDSLMAVPQLTQFLPTIKAIGRFTITYNQDLTVEEVATVKSVILADEQRTGDANRFGMKSRDLENQIRLGNVTLAEAIAIMKDFK